MRKDGVYEKYSWLAFNESDYIRRCVEEESSGRGLTSTRKNRVCNGKLYLKQRASMEDYWDEPICIFLNLAHLELSNDCEHPMTSWGPIWVDAQSTNSAFFYEMKRLIRAKCGETYKNFQ